MISFTKYVLLKNSVVSITAANTKYLHFTARRFNQNEKENNAERKVVLYSFQSNQDKQKESFLDILHAYVKHSSRRGHVEFIEMAMKYMDEFGVNKDLECYKKILDVLPKGEFVPTNKYQVMFQHYPKQQQVAMDLLSKMEDNSVIPDREMEHMLINIFGYQGHPTRKYWRMVYWMSKFNNINPWPLPAVLPSSSEEIAHLMINKISSADIQTEITVYDTKNVKDSIDKTWIVSAMSPMQQKLLHMHDIKKPVYVEGPWRVWCKDRTVNYFVLKTDPIRTEYPRLDLDDVSDIRIPFWDNKKIPLPRTVHEQNDGTYFAVCATGTSSNDSLLSWVRCLQRTNPILRNMSIVFRLVTSASDTHYIEGEPSTPRKEKIAEQPKQIRDTVDGSSTINDENIDKR